MIDIDYLLHGDYVLTMTDTGEPLTNGAVAVKGKKIVDVGSMSELSKKFRARETMGGKDRVIMPGLINTHTHASMVYFRGFADDLPLKEWLENHIWPAESKWLNDEFVSDAIELACLEMLNAGITTYNDFYFFENVAAIKSKEIGMRAVLGAGVLDFPSVGGKNIDDYIDKAENFIKDWGHEELVTPAIAPHAPYTCGPETFKKVQTAAEKYNVPIHTHLSETQWEVNEVVKRYGKTPVEHLEKTGVLSSRLIAAHCVWLTNTEIEILSRRGVGVSHCVTSNLKLASGISPVVTMLNKGIKVAFGTDGAASNNNLDILCEMGIAARLHKVISQNPTSLNAREAIKMATRYGADILGFGDTLGSIKKGKLADMVVVDLKKPHLTPIYDIYSHIVYSLRASDIESVMVNGRLLIRDKKFLGKSEEEIMEKARWWGRKIAGEN